MLVTLARTVIVVSGVWIMGISVLMYASPQTAVRFLSKAASTRFIHFSELTLRALWGLALLLYAQYSIYPEGFRLFGIFVTGTAAILFFIPQRWHARYAVWSVALLAPYLKFAWPFSLAFGFFLIYGVI